MLPIVHIVFKPLNKMELCRVDGPDMTRRSKPGTQPGEADGEAQDRERRGQAKAAQMKLAAVQLCQALDWSREHRGGQRDQHQRDQSAPKSVPNSAVEKRAARKTVA